MAYALNGAINKPNRDAQLIEGCLKRLSTNVDRLIARIIRVHYDSDPRHLLFVKDCYRQRHGRSLESRVRKETKGAYRELLLKILEGRSQVPGDEFI